jgi:hypothetical protein
MGDPTIGRLRLLLSSSARLAPALPNACSRWFHERLRDDLGHLMTRLERGADVCIEQLVLDLGIIPAENWEQILHQRLLEALQAALQERLGISAPVMFHADMALAYGSGTGAYAVDDRLAMWPHDRDNSEDDSTNDSEDNRDASGRPAAIAMPQVMEPSLGMLCRYLFDGYAEPVLHALLDEKRMISWWRQQCLKTPQEMAALLHQCAVEEVAGRRLRYVFSGLTGSWLALAATSSGSFFSYRMVKAGQHNVWSKRSARTKAFSAMSPRYFFSMPAASGSRQRVLDSRFLVWLHAQLPGMSQQRQGEPAPDAQVVMRSQHRPFSTAGKAGKDKIGSASQAALPAQKQPVLASECYQVDNAGLILLWPLLPGLFRRWGLLDKGQFIDTGAQEQAICRLDSWLWQSQQAAEWRMVLTKVLCGWPMAQALMRSDQDEGLPEAGQDLDALLRDLVAQTPGLQRCDQNDIRYGFLQRPGTLHHENQRWHLLVEPDASDVLLGELPWPVSQVSLPWLETFIEVKWF